MTHMCLFQVPFLRWLFSWDEQISAHSCKVFGERVKMTVGKLWSLKSVHSWANSILWARPSRPSHCTVTYVLTWWKEWPLASGSGNQYQIRKAAVKIRKPPLRLESVRCHQKAPTSLAKRPQLPANSRKGDFSAVVTWSRPSSSDSIPRKMPPFPTELWIN